MKKDMEGKAEKLRAEADGNAKCVTKKNTT
jgi:hypothetical protein